MESEFDLALDAHLFYRYGIVSVFESVFVSRLHRTTFDSG
jgi:hypothetical protein